MKKTLILFVLLCVNIVAWGQSERGKDYLRKANAGDAEAQYMVSLLYSIGGEGFPENEEEYIKWLKKSAENGYTEAQYKLGEYYNRRSDYGFPEERDEYLKWCHRAADGGYSSASFSLGLYYKNIDKQDAIYWLKKCMDDLYAEQGREDELAAEELRKLGVYYHPAEKTSTTTSTASSQSNSSSSGKLLYSGVYTQSSQGYSPELGWTSTPGPDFTVSVEIYNDYIIVSGSRYDYVETRGAWRIYGGDQVLSSYYYYHVNPSTYEMKHIMSSQNPFTGGYNVFQYAMTKGETTMPKYSNGNSNSGANGVTNNSRSNSTQNSSGSSSSNRRACTICKFTNGKCTTCKGSGQVLSTTYGTKSYTRCMDCGGNGRCKYCNGTGYRQ